MLRIKKFWRKAINKNRQLEQPFTINQKSLPSTAQERKGFSYPAIFTHVKKLRSHSVLLKKKICPGCTTQTLLGVKGSLALLSCEKDNCEEQLLRIDTANYRLSEKRKEARPD